MSDLIGAGTAETIVFIAATALAIASALGVVLSGNPFRSALWLILNLVSLATFYLLLNADFLAAAQVIVYAGRRDDHVPVRDRLPGRCGGRAIA